MEKNKKVIILNSILVGTIILNLFIFTSRMRFFPWFIEDAWGYLGVLLTTPILIVIYFILRYFHKQQLVTNINKTILVFLAANFLINQNEGKNNYGFRISIYFISP
ncbi:hypothetical protein QUF88_01975 [Bacillus sp. DX1.1]|uniref:hypothetical protein n=1 Tax=unclassified Bacillus (in: firmicutes) TaxID=185979 RepID=UPI00256FDEF9|nr:MULTISPECIES: hypothetical protein [unclassified Bacillus (in: firmicutes)]MDM5152746.1 hypothetical protein [Bacillus sp. DX1.1]WJE84360.1 hypothetical protein QRE67_26220 [Bacillus sp. DX3.1]